MKTSSSTDDVMLAQSKTSLPKIEMCVMKYTVEASRYRLDMVNLNWLVDRVLLRIKWKFQLQYEPFVVSFEFW